MSEKVLTEEGLLAPATTSSNDLVDTDEMEVNAEETNDEEGNNLSEPDPEPGQRSPRGDAPKKEEKKENRRGTTSYNQNKNHRTTKEINRKRRYSETLSEEKIIEHSAEVLKKPWIGIPKEEHAQRHYYHNTICTHLETYYFFLLFQYHLGIIFL